MSKNIFKIIGALIFFALIVSIGVGGVSAGTYTYSVDIVENSLALTKDVPRWDAEDQSLGYFVPAESGVGAIRQAYVNGYINSVNLTYNNADKSFSIVDINGLAKDATHAWTVKVGNNILTSVMNSISDGFTVTYEYKEIGSSTIIEQYNIIVEIVSVNYIWDGDIPFTQGMTGEQLLIVASNNQINFTYNTSDSYGYTWLDDINGISKDWYKTGYGYAISLDGEATDALNRFTVEDAYVFEIYMAASTYGGIPYSDDITTFCDDGYGGAYLLDGITDSFCIINTNIM